MDNSWSVADIPVGDVVAVDIMRRYMIDVATSYHGHPPDDTELAAALADHPNDELAPPAGFFLVATHGGSLAGCVGVRFGPAGFAELKRMFVVPEARGLGGGTVLLAAAEERAAAQGVRTMRLQTRSDLLAARRLYATHGYRDVPAFATDDPYAECWYAKEIR